MNTSAREARTGPLRVVQSFSRPTSRTNPYLTQLLAAVPGVAQRPFSWRLALLGRYDVLHIHLVDVMFLRTSRLRSAANGLLFAALMLRVSVAGTALVRTVHNVRPHERRGPFVLALERMCDRRTTLWVRLNTQTPTPTSAPTVTILHGDYRDWFAEHPRQPVQAGRIIFFGLIRRYKGVEALLDRFSSVEDESAELRIVGRPDSAELRSEILAAVQADRRVSAELEYVGDRQLAAEITRSAVVVLPYREMHNSGAAILALSLGRPILVPDNETSRELAGEYGSQWVRRFVGELTTSHLEDALLAARAIDEGSMPFSDARSWSTVGAQHRTAYERAVASARSRRASARVYSA